MAYQGASFLSFIAKRDLAPRRAVVITQEGVDYPHEDGGTNCIGVVSPAGASGKNMASIVTAGVAELEATAIPRIGDKIVVDNEGRAVVLSDGDGIQTPFICVGVVSPNVIEVLVK